ELEKKIIDDLERRVSQLGDLSGGKPSNPWAAEYAALRLARYYKRSNRMEDVRRVLTIYGRCFEQLAQGASGMLGAGWLRNVHDHYREFGLRDEAETLLIKVRECAKRSHEEMVNHTQ